MPKETIMTTAIFEEKMDTRTSRPIPHEKSPMRKAHKPALTVIDVDVHHQSDKPDALFPYLPRQYVEYIRDFGSMMPGIGYTNMPGHGARHDLWDGKDINPSTDPAVLLERHIDKYNLAIAVLTGGPYAAAVHPDPDYAAAYCRAFND